MKIKSFWLFVDFCEFLKYRNPKNNFHWRDPRVNKISAVFKRLTDILREDGPRVFRNGEGRGGRGGKERRERIVILALGGATECRTRSGDRPIRVGFAIWFVGVRRDGRASERTRPTVIGRERVGEHAGDARRVTEYIRSRRMSGARGVKINGAPRVSTKTSRTRRRAARARHARIARRAPAIITPINGDALLRVASGLRFRLAERTRAANEDAKSGRRVARATGTRRRVASRRDSTRDNDWRAHSPCVRIPRAVASWSADRLRWMPSSVIHRAIRLNRDTRRCTTVTAIARQRRRRRWRRRNDGNDTNVLCIPLVIYLLTPCRQSSCTRTGKGGGGENNNR